VALGFLLLAVALSAFDLTGWHWVYFALVAGKLATNTLAWLALVRRRGVLAAHVTNSATDLVVLTCGIYFTGGPHSPLLATYVIVIAVLALLANLGVTVLTAGIILVLFSAMMVLMAAGVLPPQPVPGAPGEAPSPGLAIPAIGSCAIIVCVPAAFSAATLRVLRAREAALEQRTAQLIQTATQRSQFVASMTHELRTPIHGVQGLADVIAAGVYGPVTDKQKDACASIKRSAQSLLSLIDDLLALTRAEAGKIDARPGPVDIPALVERVTASVSWMVGTKHLSLEADIAPELPGVESDERWLAHVLVNLVSNAVKFTPEGGRIVVELADDDGPNHATVRISDTGVGIPPDKLEAVFEPFVQVNSDFTRRGEGTGLGLAISRDLARGMGGDLRVTSELGVGSTFEVVLRRVVTVGGAPVERRSRRERRSEGERRSGTDRRDSPG
jgi:signal transduction histidine kinase